MFRSILLLALLLQLNLYSQTTLSAGDIAIVHYNADNPDEFSFLCLRTVDSGTQIYFTDNGWLSSGSFRNSEGILDWRADKDYRCGDVILVDSVGSISLSASGDQLFAYQGSVSSPSFITGFNNEDTAVWQSTASSASTSALPSSLTNNINAVAIYEIDNAVYKDTLSGSLNFYRSRVFQDSFFSGHNSTRQSFSGSIQITSGCVLPVVWLNVEIIESSDKPQIHWSTATEINCDRFEVQSSNDAIQFNTIGSVLGNGTSHQINSYRFLLPMESSYYRIKQVDFDGSSTFSDILYYETIDNWVQMKQQKESITISAFGPFKVSISDIYGRSILEVLTSDEVKINKESIPRGVALVDVWQERKNKRFKLILY